MSALSEAELSEYDAETVLLTVAAEQRIAEAESLAAKLSREARAAKKFAKEEAAELRRIVRERADQRGKPQATLLDMAKPAAAPKAGGWRDTLIKDLSIADGIKAFLSFEPVKTAGDLFDEIAGFNPADGTPFAMPAGDVAEVRMCLAELADREAQAATSPDLSDLWRQYPVSRWSRYGLTAKDVEKLADGVVKRESAVRPIRTVGDLSDFSQPTATGYCRGYADVKGIGTAGADRISEAEGRFWSWWGGGGQEEFAREKGLIRGREATGGTGSGAVEAPARAADPDDEVTDPDPTDLYESGGEA